MTRTTYWIASMACAVLSAIIGSGCDSDPSKPAAPQGNDTIPVIIPEADIRMIDPETADQGAFVGVKILGTRSHFGSRGDSCQAWLERDGESLFGEAYAEGDDSTLFMRFRIPLDARTGDWTLAIKQAGGSGTIKKTAAMRITQSASRIAKVTPSESEQKQDLELEIEGLGTHFTSDLPKVLLIGAGRVYQADSLSVSDDTRLKARWELPPSSDTTLWDIRIEQASGLLILKNALRLTPTQAGPAIVSFAPDKVERGKAFILDIRGAGTAFATGMEIPVWLENEQNNVSAKDVQVVDDSTLRVSFYIPFTMAVGQWTIGVQLPGNRGSLRSGKPLWVKGDEARILRVTQEPPVVNTWVRVFVTTLGIQFPHSPFEISLIQGQHSRHPDSVSVINDSTISGSFYLTVREFSGDWDVRLVVEGVPFFARSSFQGIRSQDLLRIDPSTEERDIETRIIVTGFNTQFGQSTRTAILAHGSDSIYNFWQQDVKDATFESYFRIPADAALGDWDFVVLHDNRVFSIPGGLKIVEAQPPRVVSFTPAAGTRGTSITSRLTGHRVRFAQGTGTVVKISLQRNGTTYLIGDLNRNRLPPSGPISTEFDFSWTLKADMPPGQYDVQVDYNANGFGPGHLEPLRDGFEVR